MYKFDRHILNLYTEENGMKYYDKGTIIKLSDDYIKEYLKDIDIQYPYVMFDGDSNFEYDKRNCVSTQFFKFKLISQKGKQNLLHLEDCNYVQVVYLKMNGWKYKFDVMFPVISHVISESVSDLDEAHIITKTVTQWLTEPYIYFTSDVNKDKYVHCKGTIIKVDVKVLQSVFPDIKILYPYVRFEGSKNWMSPDGETALMPQFALIDQDVKPNINNIQFNNFNLVFCMHNINIDYYGEIVYDVRALAPKFRKANAFDVPNWWMAVLLCAAAMVFSLLFKHGYSSWPILILCLVIWWVKEYKKMIHK